MIISLIGFAALLLLAFLRMPLGLALGLVGGVGFAALASERAAIANVARLVIDSGQKYELSVLPMFILMGLSLIHISEPTRRTPISYAVFCL